MAQDTPNLTPVVVMQEKSFLALLEHCDWHPHVDRVPGHHARRQWRVALTARAERHHAAHQQVAHVTRCLAVQLHKRCHALVAICAAAHLNATLSPWRAMSMGQ